MSMPFSSYIFTHMYTHTHARAHTHICTHALQVLSCLPFLSPPPPPPPQVSAWGGYVFIINLIPLHIFALLLMGRYSSRIYVGERRGQLQQCVVYEITH